MRRIIYVWNYREWGGAQIFYLSLMKEAKGVYDVTALIPSDSEPKILRYLKSLEIPVEFLPPSPSIKPGNGLFGKVSLHFAKLASENRLANNILARKGLGETIIHIDLGFWQSFLPLLRLCLKTNVFVTIHTGLHLLSGVRGAIWKIKGKVLSRFSSFHVIASNREAKASLKPYLGTQTFEQIEVTYSGFDPSEIGRVVRDHPGRPAVRAKYRLASDGPLLMTVGQFIERKGCWILLESLRQLKDKGEEFAFVWLSTTLPDSETLNKIEDYDLGDSFRLMGGEEIGETRDELLTLLSIADLFVLASLQEGLPIALIEAMALGLPCIATNVNAIPEAIENGCTGVLIQPNDPVQLRDGITQLLNDPQLREILGSAGKKTAFEKFNEKSTAEQTLKLYNDVWKTTD